MFARIRRDSPAERRQKPCPNLVWWNGLSQASVVGWLRLGDWSFPMCTMKPALRLSSGFPAFVPSTWLAPQEYSACTPASLMAKRSEFPLGNNSTVYVVGGCATSHVVDKDAILLLCTLLDIDRESHRRDGLGAAHDAEEQAAYWVLYTPMLRHMRTRGAAEPHFHN
ncbi:hypothetical protein J1614_006272 [Plenodomus biglobosus]|nr:hypothetical protein J1614_006272 [Plenodomus biglobosus]